MKNFIQRNFPQYYPRLRKFAKSLEGFVRDTRIGLLGIPRTIVPLRKALALPISKPIKAWELEKSEGTYCIIDSPKAFTRKPPQFVNESAFPPSLIEAKEGIYPETGVLILKGARLWSYYGASVITNKDRLIQDFSKDVWGGARHSIYTRLHLPRARALKGRTLSLITPEAQKNYHHWMMDLLPRLRLVTEAGLRAEDFNQILIKDKGLPYQEESLIAAGIDSRRVIHVGDDDMYLCDELTVPSIRDDTTKIRPEDMHYVRKMFLNDKQVDAPFRKLYITRKDAAFRHVLNEPELLFRLKTLNFEEVTMSGLSIKEQANLFSKASHIISPSSAALANLIFAPRQSKVFELLAPRWIVPYTWLICENMGQNLQCIVGGHIQSESYSHQIGIHDNIEIDSDQLISILTTDQCNTELKTTSS